MPTDALAASSGVDAGRSRGGAGVGPTRLRLDAVNGWRGPGALAIALAHFGVATDFFSYRHIEPAAPLVDLFFVLSGLVIAQAYGAKLTRIAAVPEYVVRRFGRIWPVQAATLLLLVAYEASKLIVSNFTGTQFSSPPFAPTGIDLPEAIPTNLLLLQSLGFHDRETWNYPSWSLSVEFVTYVGFAAVCLVSPIPRRVLSIALIVGSVFVLATIAPYGMRSTYDFGIFRCLAGFFTGTLCYDLATRVALPRWRHPTLVELAVVALTLAWLYTSARTPLALGAPIVLGAFVLVFINGEGLLSRLLSSQALQRFAELSFTIYMVHALVLLFLLTILHVVARRYDVDLFMDVANPLATLPGARATVEVVHLDNSGFQWLFGGLYIVGVLAASCVVFFVIEVPGRRFFSRIGAKLAPSPVRGQRGALAIGDIKEQAS